MLDFIKIFILVSVFCCMVQGYANAATLNFIVSNSNKIFINTDANIKTKHISDDKIVLTLKNTKPNTDFKLMYDNSILNDILIKQTPKNTQITIKAPNTKNLEIANVNLSKNNRNYIWLLGLFSLIFLRRPTKNASNTPVRNYAHNVDSIISHKIKTQKEKIKIAA